MRIHTDLSRVPISVAPNTATAGTSLGVTDANAAYLPDLYPYWAVLVPTGAAPTRANSEIVKVTAGSSSAGTTTLTIVRAQGIPVTTAQTVTTSFDIYEAYSSEQDALKMTLAGVQTVTGIKSFGANINFNSPQGFLINGKIVPSVTTNNLTVAIKGLDGNDPSATNPVYCRIGDTVRSITAALSVTKNAATNWFNAGSAELATKEIDYFVYLGYNATDGVVIGFSRIPYATEYDDFSATTTNEKYCAISTITNAAATDYYEVIGRFAATLSAGAGYTWTVPTFTASNLIQRPINRTRKLNYVPTLTKPAGLTATIGLENYRYQVIGERCYLDIIWQQNSTSGTVTGTSWTVTMPFTNPTRMILSAMINRTCSAYGNGGGANNYFSLLRYDSGTLATGDNEFIVCGNFLLV